MRIANMFVYGFVFYYIAAEFKYLFLFVFWFNF